MLTQVIQRGRRREKAGGESVFILRHELPGSSFSEGYAENFDEPRIQLGACFRILLPKEDPFKVIPKGKDHDAHQEYEACLLCDFSLALAEGFPEDALNQEK